MRAKMLTWCVGEPPDKRFYYLADPTRTKETVEAKRKAEQNLDNFWNCCDKMFERHTGMRRRMNFFRVLRHGETMRRTAPWAEISEKRQR
jgi:hypothetical protein